MPYRPCPVCTALCIQISTFRDQGILSSREGDLSSLGKCLRPSGKSGQPQRAFRNGEAGGLCEPKRFIVKAWKIIRVGMSSSCSNQGPCGTLFFRNSRSSIPSGSFSGKEKISKQTDHQLFKIGGDHDLLVFPDLLGGNRPPAYCCLTNYPTLISLK